MMVNGVEIVGEYKNLGIFFKPSGTFSEAINCVCKKASKALFCIRKAVTTEHLNVNLFLKLYEQCVKPILLYCSEILCLEKIILRTRLYEASLKLLIY